MKKTSTGRVLRPKEVADRFGVSVHTVANWARDGLLPSFRTGGGHRRYRAADVDALASSRSVQEEQGGDAA